MVAWGIAALQSKKVKRYLILFQIKIKMEGKRKW